MALGDWIPVQIGLSRRREVLVIAERLGRSRHEVLGLLIDFWGWASEESRECHVRSVTQKTLVDAVGGDEAFWDAVADVGWLEWEEDGITIPNWDRWLSKSSKLRLQAVLRQRARRLEERLAGDDDDVNVTQMSRSHRDANALQNSTVHLEESPPPPLQSKGGDSPPRKKRETRKEKKAREEAQRAEAARYEADLVEALQSKIGQRCGDWLPTPTGLWGDRGLRPWQGETRYRVRELEPLLAPGAQWEPVGEGGHCAEG